MIRVELFASLKDVAGVSSLALASHGEKSAAEIFDSLVRQHPGLESYRATLLIAVNEDYASWETIVGPGDQIAFFPPVSGGAQ